MAKKNSSLDKSKVFVIYGRNNRLNTALFDFLRSLSLQPLEWEQLVSLTGKSSPYVGDVLETGFDVAQCAIVFLTPDDEARLRLEYQNNEPTWETELTPQPRQNVLFEAGMAMSKFPDRTIIVQIGDLRPASDVLGRHVVKLNNSPEMRNVLATRLKTAKCSVNQSGSLWLTTGDFSLNSSTADSSTADSSTADSSTADSSTADSSTADSSTADSSTAFTIPDAYRGVSGGIKYLIENNIFDIPKEAREIHSELQNRGRYSSIQDVHVCLKNMSNGIKKPLRRLTGKPIKYVIRK